MHVWCILKHLTFKLPAWILSDYLAYLSNMRYRPQKSFQVECALVLVQSWKIGAWLAMDLNSHEPRNLEIYQSYPFRICRYCYLKLDATWIRFIAWSVIVHDWIHVEYSILCVYRIDGSLDQNSPNWPEMTRDDFALVRETSPIFRSINDPSTNTSTRRISKIPSKVRMHRLPRQMKNGRRVSMLTTLLFVSRNYCDWIDSKDSFMTVCRKFLFIKLRPAPASSKRITSIKAFDVAPKQNLEAITKLANERRYIVRTIVKW